MARDIFDTDHMQYLASRERGILATVGGDGGPQAKPVGFRFDAGRGTIEISGYAMESSAKFRNVGRRPQVAFTLDDVPDPSAGARGVRFMEIRGLAEQVQADPPASGGLSPWIIRIHPRRLVSYNVGGPGMHTQDLTPVGGGVSR